MRDLLLQYLFAHVRKQGGMSFNKGPHTESVFTKAFSICIFAMQSAIMKNEALF